MKLELRYREEKHVRMFWDRTQDEEIQGLFPFSVKSLEEALAMYEGSLLEEATSFGQVIYADDLYIGDVWCYGIDEEDEKMAMLSIVIFDKDFWGKGIGSQAIDTFLTTIGRCYAINEVGAFTYASNTRSVRALEKSGFMNEETFTEEGTESYYLSFKYKNE